MTRPTGAQCGRGKWSGDAGSNAAMALDNLQPLTRVANGKKGSKCS